MSSRVLGSFASMAYSALNTMLLRWRILSCVFKSMKLQHREVK